MLLSIRMRAVVRFGRNFLHLQDYHRQPLPVSAPATARLVVLLRRPLLRAEGPILPLTKNLG